MTRSIPRPRRFAPAGAALVLGLLAGIAPVLAGHPAGRPDQAARAAVQALAPQAKIDRVEAAPMPGFRQVLLGGQLVYVSDDGKYIMQGTLFDAKAKRDLTSERVAVAHKSKVDAVPQDQRIVF